MLKAFAQFIEDIKASMLEEHEYDWAKAQCLGAIWT